MAQSSSAPAPAASGATPTTANTDAGPYWHSFINDTIANATLWPKAATIDFNKVSLAGYRSTELRGAAGSFANLTAEERKAIVDDFHAAGKTLRVSAFGANDNVTSNGADPELLATNLAAYARTNGLDGVDINYEGKAR
jgi:chitinase